MAEDRMAVLEKPRKATADGDVDVLREGVRVLAEAIMEAEVTELTGVPKGERAPDRRLTNRNGCPRRARGRGSAARPSGRRLSRRAPPSTPPDPVLTHFTFPEAHRSRIRSTNTLERLNKEIKRRTAVVGIFPNRAAPIRLAGMILAEQDDEWQDGRHYFRPETLALIAAEPETEEVVPLLIAS